MHYYFITGTSTGLGKAIAEALLKRDDVQVYGISRTCTIVDTRYTHITADLIDVTQVHHVMDQFSTIQFATTDSIYLINNAGVVDPILHANEFTDSNIQQLLQVNLIAAIQLISAFLKIPSACCAQRVIISISSGAATKVIDGWSLYGASKAALDHFSKHVARELEIQNESTTHIYSVAPGVVDTPMQAKIREASVAGFSTRDRFINLFENDQLMPANKVALDYLRILDNPNEFTQVVFSVRDLES
jgi:benzil reductase ((S)-benzoin forming)